MKKEHQIEFDLFVLIFHKAYVEIHKIWRINEDSDWGELEAILQESSEEKIIENSKRIKKQRSPRERGRKSQQLLSRLLFASPDGRSIEDIFKGGTFSVKSAADKNNRTLKRQAFIRKALEAFDKADRRKTRRHRG